MEPLFSWLKGRSKLSLLVSIVATLFIGYQLFSIYVLWLSYWNHLNLHLAFGLVIVLLTGAIRYPRLRVPLLGAVLVAIVVAVYIHLNSDALILREGKPNVADFYMGIALIILVLVAAYLAFGIVLPLLAILSIIYAFTGPYFPPPFFHAGIDPERLVAMLATQLGGIYGTLLYISATYLAIFLALGSFIEGSRAARFFIDLPLSLFRGVKAGGGYAAVMASMLMGMGSGSPVANVVTTGTFTIPLMKRSGFRPYVAGGIEAAASTGGQLMPPVMGAVAFVMADFTGKSYINICIYALIPAILYFLSVGVGVYFRASRMSLEAIPVDQLPVLKDVIRDADYVLPIVVLVVVLAARYSASLAAFWAVMSMALLIVIHNPRKDSIVIIGRCMAAGGRRAADFAVAMACISILVKVVLATGIGLKLPMLIGQYAGGSLFLAYLLTAAASTFLGMGLPTVAAYIVVAVLAVPALTHLGADPIRANFFVLYFSILSALTPPVALAALAGAKVAKTDYFATSWASLRFGYLAFVIPFLFAYNAGLVALGAWTTIAEAAFATLFGCISACAVMHNYFIMQMRWWERMAMLAAAICFYGYVINQMQWQIAMAFLCAGAILSHQIIARRRLSCISGTIQEAAKWQK